jgi:UDP-N-acetylmuramoyl-tripeptide--D-alanyl-D-alanine ligase
VVAAIIAGLAALASAVWLGRAGLVVARIYQIEEYEAPRLLAWGRQRAWLWPNAALLGAGLALIVGLSSLAWLPGHLSAPYAGPGWPGAALGVEVGWLVGAAALHLLWRRLPAKKPLVYTARMRRILSAAAALALLVAGGCAILTLVAPVPAGAVIAALLCLLAPGWALALVIAGNVVMLPVEAQVRRGYVRRARARITAYKPRVVGIAGSYGKTSTKHITAHLLAPHVATLATPKSFNTLMGITRTINEYLEPGHRVFVVEMDAYATGEIGAMCRLVEPEIAVITAVGPQHLERFGTVGRIADALYELVAALPPGGPAVIYGGDPLSAALAARAAGDGYRVVRYGLEEDLTPWPPLPKGEGEREASRRSDWAGAPQASRGVARISSVYDAAGVAADLDVIAADVVVDARATHFTWRWPAEGLDQRMSIPLLGRHNILNVSAALAVMHLLGLPVAEAARDALRLEPVPHRLQVLPGTGGITIIDDSYNANPVGVHNGLDALAQMPGRAKILVTPGLVELGSVEEAENWRFGEHAARVCDHVILVGARQTAPIQAGLRAGGFAAERIHIVQTLDEVTATLGRIAGPGAVVLFANDLPDTYLELT